MQRKQRKYEVVAAAANAGRTQRVKANSRAPDVPDEQRGAAPMIEVSDADYRSVHLPCAALEENAQPTQKGERNPGD